MPFDSEDAEVKKVVFANRDVNTNTEGKQIAKEIYVKNKIYIIPVKG